MKAMDLHKCGYKPKEGSMGLYVGMDLHSTNCYTAIVDEEDKRFFSKKLPNDQGRILAALRPYRSKIKGVAVESTYNWYWLVDAMMEEGYRVHLANPAAMKQYEGIKHLNDSHDAFWLAQMLRLGILPEGYIYPRATRGLRDLLRQRSRLVVQKTSLTHSLQQVYCNNTGVLLSNNAIPSLEEEDIRHHLKEQDLSYNAISMLRAIRFLKEQIKSLEGYILKRIKGHPVYSSLSSVPGIGVVLALTITLETGPLSRFASASHFASYCRCVPTAYWSNGKRKGMGNRKNGNKYLSWAFAEAANFAIRFCQEAKAFYQRKCAKSNPPIAYRAVANKLAKACYEIMRDQSVFDANRLFQS